MAPVSPLLDSLRDRSLAVVIGEGGVGKTTVSAAIAALSAVRGRRVLAVTVDPSNRLKTSLGLSGPPGVEEPVSLKAFSASPAGSLHAMVLDAATELDRVVCRAAPSAEVRERIRDNAFFRKAAGRLAGTHEYMAMERLLEARESGRYDLVVLDTPPDRHAMEFLDAPGRLDALLGSDVFQVFVAASRGFGRAGLGALRWRSVVLKGIGRFAGEETFLAVLDFVLLFAPMFAGFRERAGRVRSWIAGPESATFVVTRPRSGGEVLGTIDALGRRGIRTTGVIVNRVHEWPSSDSPDVDAASLKDALLSEPALGLCDPAMLRDLATRTLTLAAEYRALATGDAGNIAALERTVAPAPVYRIPLMREDVHDLAGLARFSECI
jgi:anion-transporting  ArsA/GET3 family ATPase